MLKDEFQFYQKNKSDFLKDHKGDFVVIKGQSILGFYSSKEKAISSTICDHDLGTFLVHQVLIMEEEQKFYTRVMFNSNVS